MMSKSTVRIALSAGAITLTACLPRTALAQTAGAGPKASQYCQSVADAAADARFALQKQSLADTEKEIEARIKVLEAKRAEYEEWLKKRNEVLAKADETVVAIYSKMKPDASALQLANMDEQMAAAIISKLNPRVAGAVFNEMEPARAAQIAGVMTDAPARAASVTQ